MKPGEDKLTKKIEQSSLLTAPEMMVDSETLADETLMQQEQYRQSNPVAIRLNQRILLPDLPAEAPPLYQPPAQELSEKQRKKQEKERSKRIRKAIEQEKREELESYEKIKEYGVDLSGEFNKATALLQSEIPYLLSFDFGAKIFSVGSNGLTAAQGALKKIDKVRNELIGTGDTSALDTTARLSRWLSPEQLTRLKQVVLLRPLLAEVIFAAQNRDSDPEQFKHALARYSSALARGEDAEAQTHAEQLAVFAKDTLDKELPGVIEEKSLSLQKLYAQHPEYQHEASGALLIEGHIMQLARVKELAAKPLARIDGAEASAKLQDGIRELAIAAGDLDCKRAALARSLSKLTQDGVDPYRIDITKELVHQYDKRLVGLTQRLNGFEHALAFLHEGKTLTPDSESVLAQYGYNLSRAYDDIAAGASLYSDAMRRGEQTLQKLLAEQAWSGYALNDFQKTLSYQRAARMIDPENEEQSRAILQTLIKIEREIKNRQPGDEPELYAELYDEMTALATPLMRQLMTYDFNKLQKLPDTGLIAYQQELLAMQRAATILAVFAPQKKAGTDNIDYQTKYIKDDDGKEWTENKEIKLTFKQEFFDKNTYMIGDFDKRLNLAGAYLNIARGAALAEAQQAGLADNTMMLGLTALKLNGQPGNEDDQLKIRGTLIEKNRQFIKQQPQLAASNPELEYRRLEAAQKIKNHEKGKHKLPMYENIVNQFKDGLGKDAGEDEDLKARFRYLQGMNYRLAGSTKQHMPEMIFRSFVTFLTLKGAAGMGEAAYRQMLMDLSEGYWLASEKNPPSPHAVAMAQQINLRGVAAYKKAISVHYEYLERKYGASLENLTIEEIVEHYEDLTDESCGVQVDYNVLTKIPGAIDPEHNEQDKLLLQRVTYFNNMHAVVSAARGFASAPGSTGEEFLPIISELVKLTDDVGAKEAILQRTAKTKTDWSVTF